MVKQTQTIRRQIADELFEVFDHFVGLALKELSSTKEFEEKDEKKQKHLYII